jgi:hypothetical protein
VLVRNPLCFATLIALALSTVPLASGCTSDVATGTGGAAGTGGAGSGGATGTGGATATTSTGTGSPGTCADTCPAVVAAGCSHGPPSVAACEMGCEVVAMSCAAAFTALIACGGASPTFVCDPAGNPYPKGCEAENTALVACRTGAPEVCIEVCPAVTAAKCANGPPDITECQSGCGSTSTQCPTEFAAVASCWSASSTFTCNADGFPVATGCEAQGSALFACLMK